MTHKQNLALENRGWQQFHSRRVFSVNKGWLGALRRCYTLLEYQGSRVLTVTTGYVTRATTWTRHKASKCGCNERGGWGLLPRSFSRQRIALRQLCNADGVFCACPISKGFLVAGSLEIDDFA